MNLNKLAKAVAQCEGKKQEVNIAQIKEIISVLGGIFADLSVSEFLAVVAKMRENGGSNN